VGGGENIAASTYLEYMFYPYGSSYYQSSGLIIKEFYASYRKSPNVDIWINFSHNVNSYSGNAVRIIGGYRRISNSKINLNTLLDNNIKVLNYNQAYEAGRYSGGNDEVMLERHHSISVSTISYGFGIRIGSPEYSPVIYSTHITTDTAYYYKNGNYLGATSFNGGFKYFCINGQEYDNGRSSIKDSSCNSTIQWITLTDQIAFNVPKPPNVLEENNDNVYGCKN